MPKISKNTQTGLLSTELQNAGVVG